MDPMIATWWMLAAEAGYTTPTEWKKWADQHILAMPVPPVWIIDMSLAENVEQLRKSLQEPLDIEAEQSSEWDGYDDQSVIEGYLWIRYQRGDFSFKELLKLTNQRMLLERLEANEPEAAIKLIAKNNLDGWATTATMQWKRILQSWVDEKADEKQG